ncbi:MAG: hypothetical protein AAGA67_10930, partial [Cyanobacteria bacterium P01_F01_bin.153]
MYSLGIDFGTSGARAIAVSKDNDEPIQCSVSASSESGAELAEAWKQQLWALLGELPIAVRRGLGEIAINGTSSTVLLGTATGQVIAGPLMYNDDRGRAGLEKFSALVPDTSGARSATSALAKVWWWRGEFLGGQWAQSSDAPLIFHQADWLSFLLHGRLQADSKNPRAISDYHNALKLGYDPIRLAYPDPLQKADFGISLPHVMAPGSVIGPILPAIAQRFASPACTTTCPLTPPGRTPTAAHGPRRSPAATPPRPGPTACPEPLPRGTHAPSPTATRARTGSARTTPPRRASATTSAHTTPVAPSPAASPPWFPSAPATSSTSR